MSIAVTCPSGHLLKVADNMAGRAGRCPFCREIVNVPAIERASEGEKATLAGRSQSGRAANPAATASGPASAKAPLSGPPPVPVAPDPAAADTVLMPISLADIPPDDIAFATEQSAEPDVPVIAEPGAVGVEPDQMAQTLPLPTAELMPRRIARAPDPAHDIGFDTAGHKTKIIGSWRVLGDVAPPYIPESALNRASGAAAGASDAGAIPAAAGDAKAVAPTPAPAPVLPRTGPPPLPSAPPAITATERARVVRKSDKSNKTVAPKASWLTHSITKGSVWPLRATTYRLAAGLALVSVFSMWPALRYWDLGVAPGWARCVLLIGLLQLAYAAWLVSIPDWASLWGMMIVLAIVATMYGTVAAMTLATPMEHDPPLGLQSVRHAAPLWCLIVMLLTVGAAYLCGHAAQRVRPDAGGSKRGLS